MSSSEEPSTLLPKNQLNEAYAVKGDEMSPPQGAGPRDAGLNVRLLKERLEMEVGLLREGIRCLFFVGLCVCFATAFFLSTQPTHRAESRWYLDKRLDVEQMRDVTDPQSLFKAIMHVSSRVRELVPTSSEYVDEPLSKVLIGNIQSFPGGPMALPAARHPKLLMEWTITARLTLHDPDNPMPKKRLIIRSYPAGDTSGLSCWAWYSLGYNAFVLEYGRNNLDDYYPVAVLRFDTTNPNITTDPAATNLVALLFNATHVTIRLQNAGEISKSLYAGTVPASCQGGTIEAGDVDISLGEMVIHSKRLTEVQLQEIEYSGKTLKHMAAGFKLKDPGSLVLETALEAHTRTQKLVQEYGNSNLAVSKLTGSLAFISAGNATGAAAGVGNVTPGDSRPQRDDTSGTPAPLNFTTGFPSWNFSSPDEFWEVQGREQIEIRTDYEAHKGLSERLTAAFRTLAAARMDSFTLSWWTKGTGAPGWTELVFFDPSVPNPPTKLTMSHVLEEEADGTRVSGYAVVINGAPWCSSSDDEPCMRSPGFWCQGPDDLSIYDGIWRHISLSFGTSTTGPKQQSRMSTIEIHLDGKSLCTRKFPSDDELVPHYMSQDWSVYGYGVSTNMDTEGEDDASVLIKDMRLYHRRLKSREVAYLANDSEFMECLDLGSVSDNSEWISDFGQTCADFSGLSEASGDTYAPAACRSQEMMSNCPVSCMHELNPMCFDGTPPLPRQGSFYAMLGTRLMFADVYLQYPELGAQLRPLDLPPEALLRLSEVGEWSLRRDGTWYRAFNDIRKLDYGTFVPSETGMLTLLTDKDSDKSIWLVSTNETSMGISYSCPGILLDAAIIGDFPGAAAATTTGDGPGASALLEEQDGLVSRICSAEVQSQVLLRKTLAGGRTDRDMAESAGWIGNGFVGGLMSPNQSSTVYFWAKSSNVESSTLSPSLTAVDGQRNICFVVQGATAWLQKINLVSDFEDLTNSGTNSSAVEEYAEQWEDGRLRLDAPAAVKDTFKDNTWIFFALTIDYENGVVRYVVNGMAKEESLPEGSWGCNSLEFLMATGSDMDISPVRIGKFPMTAGSLQRIYLSTRESFMNVFTGEELSRLSRLMLVDRPLKRYTQKIVALVPPILLQYRYGSESQEELLCKGEVNSRYIERMKAVREQQCDAPYSCSTQSQTLVCMEPGKLKISNSTERFFGQDLFEGAMAYPEFAWTLEGDVVVRDGIELRPSEEYIDEKTQKIEFILSFFVPSVQVATVLFASFDTTSIRLSANLDYLQLKLMDSNEFATVIFWIFCGVVMGVISIILALPAAYQELKELLGTDDLAWWKRRRCSNEVQEFDRKQARVYSSNTTQPDVFDVLLNLAMILLMLSFLISKKFNYDQGTDTFAMIAGIDWSGNQTFSQKIKNFLDPMSRVGDMVETEESFLTAAFWMLVLCCVRLIVYLKLHPRISAITETFISVGSELVNFLFSFGIIFLFLAYIAHLTFGYLYDEFRTYKQALITQFALLIGDSSPDYSTNTLMCIYIVGFVFVCTLSLLNFLLAIVVNGYTAVTERVLENRVARSFPEDIARIPLDLYRWLINRRYWPSKLELLQTMQEHYPDVFADEEEIIVSMSRESFSKIVDEASKRRARPGDSDNIFERYASMRVLLVFPSNELLSLPAPEPDQPKSLLTLLSGNGSRQRR